MRTPSNPSEHHATSFESPPSISVQFLPENADTHTHTHSYRVLLHGRDHDVTRVTSRATELVHTACRTHLKDILTCILDYVRPSRSTGTAATTATTIDATTTTTTTANTTTTTVAAPTTRVKTEGLFTQSKQRLAPRPQYRPLEEEDNSDFLEMHPHFSLYHAPSSAYMHARRGVSQSQPHPSVNPPLLFSSHPSYAAMQAANAAAATAQLPPPSTMYGVHPTTYSPFPLSFLPSSPSVSTGFSPSPPNPSTFGSPVPLQAPTPSLSSAYSIPCSTPSSSSLSPSPSPTFNGPFLQPSSSSLPYAATSPSPPPPIPATTPYPDPFDCFASVLTHPMPKRGRAQHRRSTRDPPTSSAPSSNVVTIRDFLGALEVAIPMQHAHARRLAVRLVGYGGDGD